MSDPTKYYEAQSSGLSYKEVYNEAGNQARSRFNLPVIIEFPKEYTADERYGWYVQNDFFSTGFWSNGDAHGRWQNAIDDAYYDSKMWEREGFLGGKLWYVKGDYNEAMQFAPIINAEDGKIRFQKIPANTVLGADLGTKYNIDVGGKQTPNYLAPYNQSQKTQIASNIQNKNISITAQDPDTIQDPTKPAYIPPTPIGGMAQTPAPSIAETEGVTERRAFGGSYVDPDTGKLVTIDTPTSQYDELRRKELGVPEFESMQAFKEQSKDLVKSFLQAPADQGGYNFKGLDDGKVEFDFEMDENGIITKLDVFEVVNGKRNPKPALTLTDPTETNNKFNEYKRYRLTQDPADPTLQPPDVTGKTATGFGAIGTTGAGIGSFPLGQSLMAPGVPMPGSLQQQALSRVLLSDYRKALPAAMPGGGIPLMRGLYKTPLQLAQEAYLLSSRMGTFQPQGTIPGGTGAFGFQQYLGGQPNYIADLQAGLGAIQQVKQKIISGISPAQLTPAEQQIYTNYIGGTESNPYQGSENELALRQQLTQLLPAPLRTAAQSNLQNIYNQALATRPSTVAGMPQSLMYGGALGTGSPFQSMQPMSVNVPTGTSPVGTMGQASQAPTQTINVSGSTNMNNVMTNNNQAQTQTQTADGKSIIFNRNPDTGYMQATLNEGRAGATGAGAATAAEIDALGLGLPTTPTGGAFGNIMVKRLNDKVIDAWTIGADGKRTPLMQNLTNSKEANDQIKAQQIKIANAKATEQAKKIMTGSQKAQLGMEAPPPVPGMNAPIQPYSSVGFPRDITDPNFNVNENIFNF